MSAPCGGRGARAARHGVVIGSAAGRRHGGGLGRGCRRCGRVHRLFQRDQGHGARAGRHCRRRRRGRGRSPISGARARASRQPHGRASSSSRPAHTATSTPTPRSTAGRIDVMVDTGATMVALTYEDARARRHLSCATATSPMRVSTANGYGPRGPRHARPRQHRRHHRAQRAGAVMEPGKLGTTLLGMSFLGRLQRVDMRAACWCCRSEAVRLAH